MYYSNYMPDRRQIGEGRRRVLDYTVWDTSLVCGWVGVVVAPYQTELHGYVSLVLYVCVWGWLQVEKFYYLHYLQLCDVWWRLCVRFPKYYSQFSVRSPLSLFVCRTMSVSLIITGLVISHTLHSFEWNSSGYTTSSIYLPNTLSKIRF